MKKLSLLLACTVVVALAGTYVVAITPLPDNDYGNLYCATCAPCAAARAAKGKTGPKTACKAGCTKPCCAAKVAKKGCGLACVKACCDGPAGKVPAAAYALTLKNQDNEDTKLCPKAKYTVFVWYNWDCPFIKRHVKAGTVEKLAAKYKDKGVKFVIVNSTKHHNVARNKKEHANNELTVDVLDDSKGTLGRLLGAKTTPHVVIADNRRRAQYNGAIDNDPRGKKVKTDNYVDITLGALLEGSEVKTPKTKPYGCSVKYAPIAKP